MNVWIFLGGIVLCVLVSLLAVWLLSEATGMRFSPAVVGGVGGATVGIFGGIQWRKRRAGSAG